MEKMKIFIEGFIVGLGKIMPGVSGSVMAICFGIYEDIIGCLSSLKELKRNCSFFVLIFAGICLAVVLGSNVIKFFLDTAFLLTVAFFIGMMIPGVCSLFKNVKGADLTYKRAMLAVVTFFFLAFLNILNVSGGSFHNFGFLGNFISLFLCGILDAFATIVPGISGSALLMMVGYYEKIISILANPVGMLGELIPFALGVGIGVIGVSKIVNYLFKSHREMTYILIIILAIFSIFSLFSAIFKYVSTPMDILLTIAFVAIGCIISFVLDKIFG